MTLFDSHCHIDFPEFDADRSEVLSDAARAGVRDIFVPGTEPAQWQTLGALRGPRLEQELDGTPRLWFGAGLHPYRLAQLTDQQLAEAITRLPQALENLCAVAVGECGVDGLVAKRGGPTAARQLAVLREHILIANRHRLPIVLHVVHAHGAVLELLGQLPVECGGVVHSYSGSAELVPRYEGLGFYLGFGESTARAAYRKAHAAVREVSADHLLLETDAPDQPPLGTARSEPQNILKISNCVADLRATTQREIAEKTSFNARRVFRLDAGASSDGTC